MKFKRIKSRLAYIILFSSCLLAVFFTSTCKDIVFNNPLDPGASAEAVEIIKVITTALSGKGDLCYDGEKFWKVNASGSLNAFDMESGMIIRDFFAESGTGLTFFENKLYLGNGQNILFSLDPLSGEILNRESTSNIFPGFLTTANGTPHLIIYDNRSSSFFEYDPLSGTETRLFQVSGLAIGGIQFYREGLLVTDMNSDSIYLFSMSGAVTSVFRSPVSGIGGITADYRDNVYLFTIDGKLYKISLP